VSQGGVQRQRPEQVGVVVAQAALEAAEVAQRGVGREVGELEGFGQGELAHAEGDAGDQVEFGPDFVVAHAAIGVGEVAPEAQVEGDLVDESVALVRFEREVGVGLEIQAVPVLDHAAVDVGGGGVDAEVAGEGFGFAGGGVGGERKGGEAERRDGGREGGFHVQKRKAKCGRESQGGCG